MKFYIQMKPILKAALTLWAMFPLLPACSPAQNSLCPPCTGITTSADTLLYADAVHRLRYGTPFDHFNITAANDPDHQYSITVPIELLRRTAANRHSSSDTTAATSQEEFHLLGSRWKTGVEQFGFVNALLLGRFLDSLGKRRWALIELFAFTREDFSLSRWRTFGAGHTEHIPETNSLRIFDHKPTNADIYHFLDDWAPFDGGFFTSENDPLIFLEGEICEETWTNIVGEPPARFFPEGEDK